MTKLEKEAINEKNDIVKKMQSINISTICENSVPNSSYAPAAIDEEGNYYIYVSELSKHTRNLLINSKVSIMLIEDEVTSKNIFARKRFTINANAEIINRDTQNWYEKIQLLESKFGESIKFLKEMTDFHLFKLVPIDGLLVYGFGKAFNFVGKNLEEIKHLNEIGHKKKS
tara:strand:+ start:25 stop:537 length:513 start_codon:yes stop_codon:yes gene_type:complete